MERELQYRTKQISFHFNIEDMYKILNMKSEKH